MNAVKPQDWSGIGHDPAPGAQHVVENLANRLEKLAEHLKEAHTTLDNISKGKSDTWHGEAASAFKKNVGKLPKYLDDAHDSVDQAKRQLKAWHTVLTENQPKAWSLEAQAKKARTAVKKAESEYWDANANPDLRLDGKVYTNEEARADAQRRLDAAVEHCEKVSARLSSARERLDSILDDAKCLGEDHENVARRRAKNIREAADNHAPPDDGFWKSVGDWFKENADWFTVAASVLGVAAIFFPPLALGAMALSAVALTSHAAKFGLSGLDPTKKDSWANYLTLGGDLLGAVPGVGIVGRGVATGTRAAKGMKTLETAKMAIKGVARETKAFNPAWRVTEKFIDPLARRLGASSGTAVNIGDTIQGAATLGLAAPTAVNAASPSSGATQAANWGTAGGIAAGSGKITAGASAVAIGIWQAWDLVAE